MTRGPRTETEWKLAIVADAPETTIERWSNAPNEPFAEAAGRFRLGPAREVRQRDTYLDTSDRRLGASGIALRVRTLDAKAVPRITLKAAALTIADGLARRPEEEFDVDDSTTVIPHAREVLSRWGVDLALTESASATQRPDMPETVRALCRAFGFVVIQDRTTRRITRSIHAEHDPESKDENARPSLLGELALDTVTFPAGERFVTHREIEVEAVDEDAAGSLEAFVRVLREASDGELQPFDSNKLALGFELEQAAAAGALDRHLDERGNLRPSFYPWLATRNSERRGGRVGDDSP